MRLEPEVGESEKERERASETWAPPEVRPSLPLPVPVEKTRGPPPFPTHCGPLLIRIRPGLGVAEGREGAGVELPRTRSCGPQFGVRGVGWFRVGGKEATGRCGAGRAFHPERVGLRPRSVPSFFVSSSCCPSSFLTAPAPGVYVFFAAVSSFLLSILEFGVPPPPPAPDMMLLFVGSWTWRPPSGCLPPKGRH
uniref:Uncharacterized protein n=1 Tax=Myotis myotis TaxID=51298 RepID=A0A7J7SSB7_MYOMY|nr:hypothetical protein mMyoMyo1_009364 [Myotis myotis]